MEAKDLLKCICNPLEQGIWKLDINFRDDNPKIKSILNNVPSYFIQEYFVVFLVKLLQSNKNKEENAELNESELKRLGLNFSDKNLRLPRSRISRRLALPDSDSKINIDNFKEIASTAKYLSYFELVDFSDFSDVMFYSIKKGEYFKIKLPNTLVNGTSSFEVLSFDKTPLEELKSLLEKLNLDISSQIRKVYSPEVIIFQEYMMLLLRFSSKSITDNPYLNQNIKLAISEYFSNRRGKNESSIRFTGIAMEYLFAEIYEICIRDRPPTEGLNDMFSLLISGLKEIEDASKIKKRTSSEKISKELDKIIKNDTSDTYRTLAKSLIKLLSESQEIQYLLNEIKRKSFSSNKGHDLFPRRVLESIDTTIKYRNKISHRSEDSISDSEVSLGIRGLIQALVWWEYVKRGVNDWDKDKNETLDEMKKESNKFSRDLLFTNRFI